MQLRVRGGDDGPRLDGGPIEDLANRYLAHLRARGFAPGTTRGYAFDLLNFSRFLAEVGLGASEVTSSDLFDWLEWQSKQAPPRGGDIVPLRSRRGPAPSTVNRRVAAVRGLFEYAVMCGERDASPVPAPRRATGWRAPRRGLLGHLGPGRERSGGRLVREPRRLPESVDPADVANFIADLATHRDRAIALLMVLGGLRSAEVRSLLLRDVDLGMRRVRVIGKGNKERVVPVDGAFFGELVAYLNSERPLRCSTAECFVVLRGSTRGQALSEAGLRKIFRIHRESSGATRVRPHRLRHTFGTELASAGIDLLVLRELMGHASPETTARYVHLSADTIAAEYRTARDRMAAR